MSSRLPSLSVTTSAVASQSRWHRAGQSTAWHAGTPLIGRLWGNLVPLDVCSAFVVSVVPGSFLTENGAHEISMELLASPESSTVVGALQLLQAPSLA
jgi:hypothetical protein